MSKCRYDLSEDCHNKDCIACVLDKIRAEIENHCSLTKEDHCKYCSFCNCLQEKKKNGVMGVSEILEIIDKYKAESEEHT